MSFLDVMGMHAASIVGMAVAPGAIKSASFLAGGSPLRSAFFGSLAGGIAGVATGDNYSSTSMATNFMTGATLGGAAAGLAKFGIPRLPGLLAKTATGAAGAVVRNRGSIGRGIAKTAKMGLSAANFTRKHPLLVGSVIGGGYLAAAAESDPTMMDMDFSGASEVQTRSWRSFQDSSTGLTLALGRRVHR